MLDTILQFELKSVNVTLDRWITGPVTSSPHHHCTQFKHHTLQLNIQLSTLACGMTLHNWIQLFI